MSTSRPPALVRNVSLPVLQNSLPSHPHPRPVTRVSSFSTFVKPSLPTRRDYTDSEDDDGMVPQLPFRPCQDMYLHSDEYHPSTPPSLPPFQNDFPLQSLRNLVRTSLASLSIFLPPNYIPPPQQLKLIYISAISLLLLLPAITLCYIFPDKTNFHLLTFFLAAVPLIARTTASVFLSTAILVSLVLIFTLTASALISPVLLVWSSVVPVITFATLGNRCGVASSAITAATVAAADFSDQSYTASSRLIIASWLLFLGVIGVVQKQIRHVVIDHAYVPAPESSTVRRKEWHVEHDFLHAQDEQYYDHLTDHSDVEVPDAVLLPARSF